MRGHGLLLLAALPVLAQAAAGQTPAPAGPVPSVTVRATRDPVDKSYRRMIQGMQRFERDHAMAPQAGLRFRVLPRLPTVNMSGITLRIVGDNITIPVPVAPDNSFVLPRNEQALREDAAVVANRKTTSMTWRAAIVRPGLPPGTRRLGDLRLECLVGVEAGLVSNSSPLIGWLADKFTSADQVCNSPDGNYLFFTERPVFSVTLRSGARTEVLPFKMLYAGGSQTGDMLRYCDCQALLDRTYYAPIWDKGWPDDTLLEFEYMDDPPAGVQ
jgi:hypothetical protein